MNSQLLRIETPHFPIYLSPEKPFWFIPNTLGDAFFRRQLKGEAPYESALALAQEQGLSLESMLSTIASLNRAVDFSVADAQQGRQSKKLEDLSELWIHLTDDCNLSCNHCLFSCKPDNQARTLSFEAIKKWVEEAYHLGCRLVVFTGGEPFVHEQFVAIVKWCQSLEDMSVAVLTNGLLLSSRYKEFEECDKQRLHFQISLDGLEKEHDVLRGKGNYKRALAGLDAADKAGLSTSVVMAVNQQNVEDMPAMIDAIHKMGQQSVHFMWHFVRGKGQSMERVASDTLIDYFKKAVSRAKECGVTIDNLEAIKAQLFSPVGTRYDLTNAGWESLAIGPDQCVYPTPALVEMEEYNCGSLDKGLEDCWRNSELLKQIRTLSLQDVPEMAGHAWRYIIGGGDLDHAIYNKKEGRLIGMDPYVSLYEAMIVLLLEDELNALPVPTGMGLRLRMGDVSTECPSGEDINFTHCNCLLSMGDGDHRSLIRAFYAERAQKQDSSILNPVHYDASEVDFIPEEGRVRQYGCGSPVTDAALQPGEVLLDLGSGTGVEVFIAAKQVGPKGKAMGLDMTDAMLDVARRSQVAVAKNLGYENVMFHKGYLENMPLDDRSVDVVISNCVINLTSNKRCVFKEILRILKPGGRLVVSDVVTETEPSLAIRADQKMKGECLGGAYVQDYLFTVLKECGFESSSAIKRFPYRNVQGHMFYSLTFSAYKPLKEEQKVDVMYSGPGQMLQLENGSMLHRGVRTIITLPVGWTPEKCEAQGIFIVNTEDGSISNSEGASSCCCAAEPAEQDEGEQSCCNGCDEPGIEPEQNACNCNDEEHHVDCLVCGAPLQYFNHDREMKCEWCGTLKDANAACTNDHFVCDNCHSKKPIEQIRTFCLSTKEPDMLAIYRKLKHRASIPMHGPEHHAMVPGIILAAYRNAGGSLSDRDIEKGMDRAQIVPGGMCGFMGICGSAIGVGIAFGIIQKSTPLTPVQRQNMQQLVAQIGLKLSEVTAARCCQREVVTSLKIAAELSEHYLPIALTADAGFACEQYVENKECIGATCSLFVKKIEEKAKDSMI